MRTVTLDIDPEHLPPIDLPIDGATDARLAAAIDALARGDRTAAAALKAGPEATPLELLTVVLAAAAKSEIARREALVDRLATNLGTTSLVLLLKALCRENAQDAGGSGDAETARTLFAAAFAVSAGASLAPGHGPVDWLAAGLDAIVQGKGEPLADRMLLAAARGLNRLEAMATHGAVVAARFQPLVRALAPNQRLSPVVLLSAADVLGMTRSRDFAWQDRVFKDFTCPLLRALMAAERTAVALAMELPIHETYIKRRETAAHFKQAYDQLTPIYAEAGRKLRQTLPPMPAPKRRDKYRVAFLVPNLVDLAHVRVTLDVVECLHESATRRLDCTLASFICSDPDLRGECARKGTPIVIASELKGAGGDTWQALLDLRTHFMENEYDAVVWVTSAPAAAFSLAMRLAPVQIFFSLKYHSFALGEIDDYLTTGAAGQHHKFLDGRRWRTAQAVVSNLADPAHAEAATRIRASFPPGAVILSCIGREEKIDSEPFLETVAEILKRHPNAIFLWSGREQRPRITQRFLGHGVADRARFIGWVDPGLYAQVTDIFLDSFPFPCGHTILQAMAVGKAVVFYDSPESRASGIPMYIEPVLNGAAGSPPDRELMAAIFGAQSPNSRFLLASDPSEYERFADRLISDEPFRQAVGNAAMSFIADFMTNKAACAASFQEQIVEVIGERSIFTP